MGPFTLGVSPEILVDLRDRLVRTRWPDQVEGGGWEYGTELSYLRELIDYWVTKFDWRKQELLINELPQYCAKVSGLNIHFVHVNGKGPQPFPLVITHGWPSSFFEMHKIIRPLADPASYGGDPADAFDVIVPSLPGFGFSERPVHRGPVRVVSLLA